MKLWSEYNTLQREIDNIEKLNTQSIYTRQYVYDLMESQIQILEEIVKMQIEKLCDNSIVDMNTYKIIKKGE